MNKYDCIILHCRSNEECMTSPIMFNTALANSGRIDKISFTDPALALLTLAEDIASKAEDQYKYNKRVLFKDYLFELHKSSFDLSGWNDERTIIPNNSERECFWDPFWTDESLKAIQKNEFIFIPSDAELILSFVLIENNSNITAEMLGFDQNFNYDFASNQLKSVIDNAGKIWS